MSEIYYQKYGEGPCLILLHGWGMTGEIWQPILKHLSQNYTLYVVDLPGFGRSPRSQEPLSLTGMAETIIELMPEQAHLLGWSLGGLVATCIASMAPHRVNKLINVASTPRFVGTLAWPGVELAVLEKFTQSLLQDYQLTLQRFLALQVLGCQEQKLLLREIKTLLTMTPEPAPKSLIEGLHLLLVTDLRDTFAQLSCSMLSILGNLDALVPRAVAPLLSDLNPNCRVIMMNGASHMPFLSHPEQFCFNVNKFLE